MQYFTIHETLTSIEPSRILVRPQALSIKVDFYLLYIHRIDLWDP
jgi:hypothetical protein